MTRPALTAFAVPGVGEVGAGEDLATLLDHVDLADGDVVVVTSKIVSKAEGRVVDGEKDRWLDEETDRVVARRGPTTIARTHHGLVLAGAGIDTSNVTLGSLVLLPVDPDASARALREKLSTRRGVNVAVIVSDTAGRAWRVGQTDIAIGAAGLEVTDDHAGRVDAYGNSLAVTMPAVADELAGAADLVKGKLSMSPIAVVRGLAEVVQPVGEHGPGAAALVRPDAEDMFGLGAREAVQSALTGSTTGFGEPADAETLAALLAPLVGDLASVEIDRGEVMLTWQGTDQRALGRAEVRTTATATAYGWFSRPDSSARTVFVKESVDSSRPRPTPRA